MTVKQWVLVKLAGPFGIVFRPIAAAMIGVVVAAIYAQGEEVILRVGWLHHFVDATISRLDPSIIQMLTPSAIGGTVALLLWGFGMDWVGGHLRAGAKQIQDAGNASPVPGTVKRDGIILENGETVKQAKLVSYATLYPGDKGLDVRPATPARDE